MVKTVQRMEQPGYDFIYLPEHTIFPVVHERKMGRTFYDTVGPDGQVKRTDGYRAAWEHYKGKPLICPKPQY